jgi:hypothetical protein
MALIKVEKLDKVEAVNLDSIPVLQCRHVIYVEDDGQIIGGKQFHRHVINPTDDVSGEDPAVQAMAAALFTDEVKAAYAAKLAENV